jgi:hypothetical protein
MWVCQFKTNRVTKVTQLTFGATPTFATVDYILPNTLSRPRRLSVSPVDQSVWFTDFLLGQIGQIIPSSPPLTPTVNYHSNNPSGASNIGNNSVWPYGICVRHDGTIWWAQPAVTTTSFYNPTNNLRQANGDLTYQYPGVEYLTRYNPANGSFLNWVIPAGGGTVRLINTINNSASPFYGDLYFGESGVGIGAIVTISP